eukprot:c22601_g1_i2 orf=65-937(-)
MQTGSIYYLNRSSGVTSYTDPRKSGISIQSHSQNRGRELNSRPLPSPTTSELTVEVSNEACKSKAKQTAAFDMNKKPKCGGVAQAHRGGEEGKLDLNLSLHVGYPPSKSSLTSKDVSAVSAKCPPFHPLNPINPSQTRLSSSLLPATPSSSSSSSSSASSPVNSSFTLSQSLMSRKEPSVSQGFNETIFKPENNHLRFTMKRDSFFSDVVSDHQHLLNDYSLNAVQESPKPPENHVQDSSTSMVTVACANCLMFVMLSRSNPKCPKCGTCPDQLDFTHPPLKKVKLGFSL